MKRDRIERRQTRGLFRNRAGPTIGSARSSRLPIMVMILLAVGRLASCLGQNMLEAEANSKQNIVIQAEPTEARQLNRQPQYHLSHRQPPSLVPLTIRRSSGESRPAPDRMGALQQAEPLAQLQLPMELHLRLRPLALPMPPPLSSSSWPQSSQEASQPKTKRSLAHQQQQPQQQSAGPDHPAEQSGGAARHQPEEKARRQAKLSQLKALSWQEAKRVLLSSVSPTSQSRLERRALTLAGQEALPAPTTTTPTTPTTTTTPTPTTTKATATAPSSGGNETQPAREVRRQRHSSQREHQDGGQQNQEPEQHLANHLSDSSFQAMAAAMLPFFWPSFQLAGKLSTSRALQAQLITTTTTESSSASHLPQVAQPTMNATSGGQPTPVASSELRPTVLAPDLGEQVSGHKSVGQHKGPKSKSTDKPTRRKKQRRQPSYLAGALGPATSHPDSTRLASKYPMPKIKFSAATTESSPLLATTQVATTTTTNRPLARQASQKLVQVPKELSKLIEQQLLANGSLLLLQHRNQKGPAPSTSVSKVIRLANETSPNGRVIRLKVVADTTSSRQQQDLKRKPTTTTTTTQMPHTTTGPVNLTSPTVVATTSTTPNPTTTTKFAAETTTAAPKRRQVELEASNRVLPEEEDEAQKHTQPATTQSSPPSSTRRPKYGDAVRQQQQLANSKRLKSNIKLFHFKRKPDMNKLPFYKKPLNYTELGWTEEQIQEHMESVGFSSLLSAGGAAINGERSLSPSSFGNETFPDEANSLLKRKRRGKNQFERLMAELHGEPSVADSPATGLKPTTDSPQDAAPEVAPSSGRDSSPAATSLEAKLEPLVMKPIFFAMKQKRKSRPSSDSPPATTTVAPIEESATDRSRSQPMVRTRRKHHGEQPPQSPLAGSAVSAANDNESHSSSSQLFASGWPAAERQAKRGSSASLLLVPSGLLTPSGSHLMPRFASSSGEQDFAFQVPLSPPANAHRVDPRFVSRDEQARFVNDFFGWQPAVAQQLPFVNSKPTGGLAPSGEENFLLAPASSSSSSSSSLDKMMPLPATQLTSKPAMMLQTVQTTTVAPQRDQGELRVPKLLAKPMRPAKYSLNGYIPKPSLGQQIRLQSSNSMANQQQQQQQQQVMTKQQARQLVGRQTLTDGASIPISGRDLESSTSNEIFSRRRGLQQHLRQTNLGTTKLLDSLADLLQANGANQTRQMEENKRKYILQLKQQQQLSQTPVLSIQRANMIKAKLGLAVGQPPKRPTVADSHNQRQAISSGLATANSIAHVSALDPAAGTSQQPSNDLSVEQRHALLVGAASTGTIPKTDFECTDKKGRFVSGLFADSKTGCQVWHLCANNRKYSFLCPSGTIFSEKLHICDWRYNVRCENSLIAAA